VPATVVGPAVCVSAPALVPYWTVTSVVRPCGSTAPVTVTGLPAPAVPVRPVGGSMSRSVRLTSSMPTEEAATAPTPEVKVVVMRSR
jgi:hypothetical protein